MSPVGNLYYKYGKTEEGHPKLQRIDGYELAKATLLTDNTSRLGAQPEAQMLYRFTPAGNLTELLWGVENES